MTRLNYSAFFANDIFETLFRALSLKNDVKAQMIQALEVLCESHMHVMPLLVYKIVLPPLFGKSSHAILYIFNVIVEISTLLLLLN